MAIVWGSYEGGMRVGIDVDVSAVSTNSSSVTFTVRYYTDNSQSFSDSQQLNLSGSIDGTISYDNNQSGSSGATQRGAARTYTYNYSTWGTSPGNRTFTVTATGLYTGGTPSRSVTVAIPARPYAAPLAPTNVAATRISDTQTKITWTRNVTAQRPYTSQRVLKSQNDGALTTVASGLDDALTSYTAATVANARYRFQVWAGNSIDVAESAYSGYIYTTPSVPTGAARADIAGPGQRITWSNAGIGYAQYTTDILAIKNGAAPVLIGNVASGVATFDHLTSNATPYTAGDRWKYVVRHKAMNGNQPLYSANSNETSETAGVTSPPNAPTNLNPTGGVSQDPTGIITLEWKHNPTDSSAQQQYQIRHRVVGAGSWTTLAAVASGVASHGLAANTYTNGQTVEWQVATKGADAAFSAFSASATFTAVLSKKVPVYLDTGVGRYVADYTGGGWSGMAKPAARVRRQATPQSFANSGTSTAISWDTIEYTRDGATAGSSGITVPRAGLYRISAQLGLVSVAGTGLVQIAITVNGTTRVVPSRIAPSGSSPTVCGGSVELMLNPGDVVSCSVFHTNGATRDTFGDPYETALSVSYNGPAT